MISKPEVELRQINAERDGISARWHITWVLKNRAPHPLCITAVRFPHQQFKSIKRIFDPSIELNGHGEIGFSQLIECNERPGLVTENAFCIFYVRWSKARWRLFVRLRVVVQADGSPQATTEMLTVQKAGFSGVES